jgi:hypothetical protein
VVTTTTNDKKFHEELITPMSSHMKKKAIYIYIYIYEDDSNIYINRTIISTKQYQ